MARGKKKESLTVEERLKSALVPEDEQPYEIPENWCWVRGRSILADMETRKPTGDTFGYIDIDSIDNNNQRVSEPKITLTANAPSRASRRLHTGDTVFSMVRPYLKNIAYIDESLSDCIASTGFYICTPNGADTKYWYYLMISPYVVDGLNTFMKGDNSPSIRKDDIELFAYPLPPLSEQRRIVERIESLFSQLDEARDKAQEALDSFEERKISILHDAFSGRLTSTYRNINNCDSWKKTTIGALTDIVSSKRIYKEEYTEDGIPFFRSSEVVDLYDTGYTEPAYFISKERYEEIKKKYGVPETGDLLVTSVGTIGKTWIVDEREFYYKDGNLTQIKKCKQLNMRFLQYYIMSNEFMNQVLDTVAGTAYNALTIVKFKNINISLPSIIEQKEIVRILDIVFKREREVMNKIEQVTEQIDLIKKSILTKAFRGELGTNDPEEESAIGLIKEILQDSNALISCKSERE